MRTLYEASRALNRGIRRVVCFRLFGVLLLLGATAKASDMNSLDAMVTGAVAWGFRYPGEQNCHTPPTGKPVNLVTLRSGSTGVAMLPDQQCVVRFFMRAGRFIPRLVTPINPGWGEDDYAETEFKNKPTTARSKIVFKAGLVRYCLPNEPADTRALEEAVTEDAAKVTSAGKKVTLWLPRVCAGDPLALVLGHYSLGKERLVSVFTRDQQRVWTLQLSPKRYPHTGRLRRAAAKKIVVKGRFRHLPAGRPEPVAIGPSCYTQVSHHAAVRIPLR